MAIIDILCRDGSPLKITEKTIYGDGVQLGVGGAELYLLTMCRAWTEAGHTVRLYNDPRELGASCFEQKPISEFDGREERDFLIIFRSPNEKVKHARGKKIWLSCDQQTVGDFSAFSQKVDKIVTISPFHAQYFRERYNIEDTVTIDIPVREWDYNKIEVAKNPMQVLFCSIPDRGLVQLADVWEMITKQVPEAQLHITSDWRLWDANISPNLVSKYRLKFAKFTNVHYHSAVTRMDLVKLQLESAIHLYPCIYDELFCISSAETQYAGCYPITSFNGALSTTNMGRKFPIVNLSDFANETIWQLQNPYEMGRYASEIQAKAKGRFSIQHVLDQWNNEVFN